MKHKAPVHALELKIPPPVYLISCVIVMYLIARWVPAAAVPLPGRMLGTAIGVLIGVGLELPALASFFRSRTTIWPTDPRKSTTLVTGGVYRVTRNPMYLGMAFVLLGVGWWCQNAASFLIVPLFVLVITRFQVIPEERILAETFGEAYSAYKARTPRWLIL